MSIKRRYLAVCKLHIYKYCVESDIRNQCQKPVGLLLCLRATNVCISIGPNGSYVEPPTRSSKTNIVLNFYQSGGQTKNRSQRRVENAIQRRVHKLLVTLKKRVPLACDIDFIVISSRNRCRQSYMRSQSQSRYKRYIYIYLHFNYLCIRRGVTTRLCGKYNNRDGIEVWAGGIITQLLVGIY